jgi:hypothetical protein
LEQKIQEDIDKKSRDEQLKVASKVAGAVGLIAIFIATGGNLGP